MDRRPVDLSKITSDDIFCLLESIDSDELNTDIEENSSHASDLDENVLPIIEDPHCSNSMYDTNSDENSEDYLPLMYWVNHKESTSRNATQSQEQRKADNETGIRIDLPTEDSHLPDCQNSLSKANKRQRITPLSGFIGSSKDINPKSQQFKNILWRKKHIALHEKQIKFKGLTELPQQFSELKTPYDCFNYFFDDSLYQHIADQNNLYARQVNISTKFITSAPEIRKFVGILLYMSVYKYPNTREYWAENSFEHIRQTMTRNRFEEIRRFLHFNNNDEIPSKKDDPRFDAIYKVRPIVDYFNKRFQLVPMNQRLCVDEQMCSTKMASHLRQYMPAKPHKRGMKLFVLCDSYGFSYAFELYSGAGDNKVPSGVPDLGAASNVVSRLSQIIPDHKQHILYFDNYYTAIPLMIYLYSRGIFSLGTIRTNRIANCKLSTDKQVQKEKRGYSEEYVASCHGVDISTTLWKDNK